MRKANRYPQPPQEILTQMDLTNYYLPHEVMKVLNKSRQTIRRWVKNGELSYITKQAGQQTWKLFDRKYIDTLSKKFADKRQVMEGQK